MDLTGADLRRGDLHGEDLRGASLRGADLRGADLHGVDLRDADLSSTRIGMSARWTAVVALVSLLLSVGVGLACGAAGAWLHDLIRSDDPVRSVVGVLIAAELLVLVGAGIVWGPRVAASIVLPVLGALAVAVGLVAVVTGVGTGAGALAFLAFTVLGAVVLALASLARVVAGTAGDLLFVVVALAGALSGNLVGGGLTSAVIAIGAMLIARRAPKTEAATGLSAAATRFACLGSTSFRGADLRGATLTGARIGCADLREAALDPGQLDEARVRLALFGPEVGPAPLPAT